MDLQAALAQLWPGAEPVVEPLGGGITNHNFKATIGGEESLLDAYFGEPPTAARRASLKLMRFMSDFREAMWGVVQGVVSELDFDFGGYAAQHFERLARTAEDQRFRAALDGRE